jgi:isoleucyl-tRNA synthetase
MEVVLEAVVLGRACRNTSNIKNRQPIGQMYVKAEEEISQFYLDIIRDELNVKAIEYKLDVSDITSYNFKPQLKTLGRRFGKNINAVKEILANLDGQAAMKELKSEGTLTITVDGVAEALTEEDLLIEAAAVEGFVSNTDHGVTVVLDTNMTPELLEEGFVREIISKVQTIRKDAGFEVMDHIQVSYDTSDDVAEIFDRNKETISSEVLADSVAAGARGDLVKEWNINGKQVTLGVTRL